MEKNEILEKVDMTERERTHIRGEIFTEINELLPFKHKDLLDLENNSGGSDWLMESDIEKIKERLQDIGNSLNYLLKHLQAFQGLKKLNPKRVLGYALTALGFRGLSEKGYVKSVPHRWLEKDIAMNKGDWEKGE